MIISYNKIITILDIRLKKKLDIRLKKKKKLEKKKKKKKVALGGRAVHMGKFPSNPYSSPPFFQF